jgi:hypothetical protein
MLKLHRTAAFSAVLAANRNAASDLQHPAIGEDRSHGFLTCQLCFRREASESAADAVANVRRTRGVDHLDRL